MPQEERVHRNLRGFVAGLSSSPRAKTQPTSSLLVCRSGGKPPPVKRCAQYGHFREANGLPHGIRDMDGNQQTEQTANRRHTP